MDGGAALATPFGQRLPRTPWKTPEAMPAGWRPLWDSFCRAFLIDGDVTTLNFAYGYAVAQFGAFSGHPTPLTVTRRDVEDFLLDLKARRSEATVNSRFRGLRRFYNWLVEEGELEASPLKKMRPPEIHQQPPLILGDEALRRILKTCEGRDFYARRDAALIRVLLDTGGRREGVASMRLDQVDLDAGSAVLEQKGGGRYIVSLGQKAVRDLDRYLRVRALHPQSRSAKVWIGFRGDMTGSGIYQVVKARAREAGIEQRVFAHLFRHTFAHLMKSSDARDEDIMLQGGWRDRRSLERYGRSAATSRAMATHKRLSPGDRI